MKEKISKVLDRVKGFWNKITEQMKKINVINKIIETAVKHRFVLYIVFFLAVLLGLILIATLGWGEFVVPVCALVILEVTMSVLLHRSELWVHGTLLILHMVVGILIGRVPMTILCMVAYVTTTLTQNMAFNKAEKSVEVQAEVKTDEKSTIKKKNKSNKKK